MGANAALLIASLGAVLVLLMLYVYMFMFERRTLLCLWFAGWAVIACNYVLDAFFPYILRQDHILFISLCSYFCANLLITLGTVMFLEVKASLPLFFGTGTVWFIFFCLLSRSRSGLELIQYTALSVYVLYAWVGRTMFKAVKKFGKSVLFLGLLNIGWVASAAISTFVVKTPKMAPYVVSQALLILNAIGLIQLFIKGQKDEIKRGLEKITYLTSRDELTGLYNKNYFENKIRELDESEDSLPVSLLFGDMNGLKFFNDVFGHEEGDNRLKDMALIIKRSCRQNDIIARLGGDEFAVILPGTDGERPWASAAGSWRPAKACGTDL